MRFLENFITKNLCKYLKLSFIEINTIRVISIFAHKQRHIFNICWKYVSVYVVFWNWF